MGTPTHCPYCAFQCGMKLSDDGHGPSVSANPDFPVNKGALCIKGWTATDTLRHPDRLLTPLVRNSAGELAPATWDEAVAAITGAIEATQAKYGKDAVGIFGGGSLTNEKSYLLGKFARVALGTSNIDYNGRFCMSSAAAAGTRALGVDRGLPFPLEDIANAETILLVGSNPAVTMPPIMQYFEAQRANGGNLIVADPRLTATAETATLHLRLAPGSDAALANGLLHILIGQGLIDSDYIAARTEGFEQVRGIAATYWPERVERITGIPEAQLLQTAHMLGRSLSQTPDPGVWPHTSVPAGERGIGPASRGSAMILTGRGPEQQSQGVNNALSFINLALALGLVGKRNSGWGCLTGQGNGQGGREHGQKADQLPGYRLINDPAARKHVASVWGIDGSELPGPGRSAFEMLDSLGQEDGVRCLIVMGSNVVVSAPDSLSVEQRLKGLDFLVVADYFLSETAQVADVVLPSAQWAEEQGTMTNLEGRVILRQPAFDPPGDARTDLEIIQALAARLGKERFFAFQGPGKSLAESVFEELGRASAGGPADYSAMSYEKLAASQGLFWPCSDERPEGTPRMFQALDLEFGGFPTASGNAKFHAVRHQSPDEEPDEEFPLYLTTGRVLAQYQSGTQTRRIDQLNELEPSPQAEVNPVTAERYGLSNGDPVRLETRRGAATLTVKVSPGIRPDTVFAPFHWAGEQSANRLTNPALDPVSRMPEFKVCAVRIMPVPSYPAHRPTQHPSQSANQE